MLNCRESLAADAPKLDSLRLLLLLPVEEKEHPNLHHLAHLSDVGIFGIFAAPVKGGVDARVSGTAVNDTSKKTKKKG
jgi:hypothetical protein